MWKDKQKGQYNEETLIDWKIQIYNLKMNFQWKKPFKIQ